MKKENYNIIVLVISSLDATYQMLEQSIRDTWAKKTNSNIKVLFCYTDNRKKSEIIEDKLYCNAGDEYYMNIGAKTVSAFEFIEQNYSYNFIYRTNLSSYLDTQILNSLYKYFPKNKYYTGVLGNVDGISYCSGSGYLLSRDLVQLVLKNKKDWNHEYVDDISLGLLLRSHNITPINAQRFNVDNDEHHIPSDYYHYRVKNAGDRSVDVIRMKKIHELKNK